MGHLVSIAHEVPLDEGSTLFTESDTPAVLAVLAGRISLESAAGEPPITIEAGDVVGVYETLAGAGSGRRAVVVGAGRSLRIEREELFELLGQRPELLQQLFGALFRARPARMVVQAFAWPPIDGEAQRDPPLVTRQCVVAESGASSHTARDAVATRSFGFPCSSDPSIDEPKDVHKDDGLPKKFTFRLEGPRNGPELLGRECA